jgi:hypothetical protein
MRKHIVFKDHGSGEKQAETGISRLSPKHIGLNNIY